VTKWTEQHSGQSASTRNLAIHGIQRPVDWAARQGYLDRNPTENVEQPAPGRRQVVL
jgi:hypothetical protein